jgi:glutaredoxin-related protein
MEMKKEQQKKVLAIIGGGPAGLFVYKRLVESGNTDWEIHIYERGNRLGAGMPYSSEGANDEHVTNVSDNELPHLVTSMDEWIETAPQNLRQRFGIHAGNFNEYKVVPRLLFGCYLSEQFALLQQQAAAQGLSTKTFLNCTVTDIAPLPGEEKLAVLTATDRHVYDAAIICTGHNWPRKHEGKIPNYFDSPYPPAKLRKKVNYPVAIRGSSLTAFDALRTLSREAGSYRHREDGMLSYTLCPECAGFKLVMHSLHGLLPAIRIHLDDANLSRNIDLSEEELQQNKAANEGFVSLDFLFERNFKEPFREKDPQFWEKIKEMSIEEFVDAMMDLRERLDPFTLFKAEYAEAEKSIRRQQPVHWKELLSVLSFTMNYPAKHLSAEDMLRLKKVLMPLISIVIAFVPQSSAQELIALYEAGVLDLVPVDRDSEVIPQERGGALYRYKDEAGIVQEVYYPLFVDCIGQPHLSYNEVPFPALRNAGAISPARLRFRSAKKGMQMKEDGHPGIEEDSAGNYYLPVPGININDHFQVLDQYGAFNLRLYMMAVPYIGGLNPDYSGLDFCEAASERIVAALLQDVPVN